MATSTKGRRRRGGRGAGGGLGGAGGGRREGVDSVPDLFQQLVLLAAFLCCAGELAGQRLRSWCVIMYFYTATCAPKGHGSGLPLPRQRRLF